MREMIPMLKSARLVHLMILACVFCASAFAQRALTPLVNTFVGTAKNGHTFPGASVPFGMVQLSPDTRTEGWDACSGYHYSDSTILGFSHTHLSGTGVGDYGDILIMPTVGPLVVRQGKPARDEKGYWSRFRHSEESAAPGYYRVRLETYDVLAELTATNRVGLHRYTFPKSDKANIIIDLKHGLGVETVLEAQMQIVGDREIIGFRRSSGWAKNQVVYFSAQFSKPFTSFGIAIDDSLRPRRSKATGKNVKGYAGFRVGSKETIVVKVGLSSISVAGARKNIQAEVPGWDFEAVKNSANRQWNTELNRIWVDGGTEPQRRTFYTALYHTMLAPNVFSDVDGRYRGMDGTIRKAEGFQMYTVFSLWDTFRAEHPLFTIIDRRRALEFVQSLMAKYEESGLLPVWELASNETWCMIGYHAVPVILDAYVKGIREFDVNRALVAMRHGAQLDHYGLRAYRENGYIASEAESESVSKTLEYAYDDWCIARLAELTGKNAMAEEFGERGQFFRNLFDPSTGFMRAKENGRWVTPFDPTSVTVNYTEANAWQYSFFVPQDIPGLIELHGGRKKFAEKLSEMFRAREELTGRNQLDISGMVGQYAHGNEPSHHMAYLFNYAGMPWRTQELVRRILDSLYSPEPDGLCGNDDCGQMSAWYVFSAMGFYPVTPGDPFYSIGSPLFECVTLRLENGKSLVIRADGNSHQSKYVQSTRLNGKAFSRTFLTHDDLMNGGSLEFSMGPTPGMTWGTSPADSPPPPNAPDIVSPPVIEATSVVFADSLEIRLSSTSEGAEIYLAVGGDESPGEFRKYESPVVLTKTCVVFAYASNSRGKRSKTIRASFVRHRPVGTIRLAGSYSRQYTGGGDNALLDGKRGNTDFRLGVWQGYEGGDLDAVVDLGSSRHVERVGLGCLQDNNSWIFFPREVEFAFSSDGQEFGSSVVIPNLVSPDAEPAQIKEFTADVSRDARFVRIRAKNLGICPDWHKGAGGKAWLFVDEITFTLK